VFCAHCGKENPGQAAFCFSCGGALPAASVPPAAHVAASKRCPACGLPNRQSAERCGCGHSFIPPTEGVAGPISDVAPQAPPHTLGRPTGVTVLAVLQFFGAAVCLLAGVVGIGTGLAGDSSGAGMAAFLGCVFLVMGSLQLACGIGLWKLKPYGRTIQLVLGWIGLLGIPFGTIISIVILWYLFKPGMKLLFSGKSTSQFTADERAQVAAATAGSMGMGIVVGVVVLLFAVFVIGIIAAIAIPGLLRARMAGNEAAAIGTMRAINSAQATYYQQCKGYAPDFPALRSAGDFFRSDLTGSVMVVGGYNITLEPAERSVVVQNLPAGCTGTVTEFFAHADPLTVGGTGTRFFATDARGIVYQSRTPMSDTDSASPVQ
jgi:type IV pilus assembly protein PilA